jgi:hypothetical protein
VAKKRIKKYIKRQAGGLINESIAKNTLQVESKVDARIDDLAGYVEQKFHTIQEDVDQLKDLLITQRDNIPYLKARLQELRSSSAYKNFYTKRDPLVSVRIATYNRAELLTERAIPSIINQTYQNFEIVIVGDHCTDDTEERIKKIKDKRIRFYNLPQRSYYPEDPLKKWLVVGAKPANTAVNMAKGDWIATLDDDDVYRPNHLQTLVNLALENKSEMAYSALIWNYKDGKHKLLWSDPPRSGNFSMMGALYLRALADFIQTDEQGWAVREPQDWYLARRMLEAGVKIASKKIVTGDVYFENYQKRNKT